MKLLKANEINSLRWMELFSTSPTRNFFQSKDCFDFYSQLSFLKPFAFAVENNNELQALVCGYLIADKGLIKSLFSRRAIVPGGILIRENSSSETISILLDFISESLRKEAIYIEFRNYLDYKQHIRAFKESKFEYYAHLNFHLQTTNYDSVWNNLSKSKRRQITTSLKSGAEISEASNLEEVREYYNLIFNLYKYKIKLPLFPIEFFEKLFLSDFAKLLLIKHNEKIVGGITCVLLKEETVYEWFVCGDDSYDKKIYPSVLATWAGIEYATQNNYRYFDFMGAGKPDTGYGVFEFKSKFGGNEVEHGRFIKVNSKFLYAFGKLTIKTIQLLKLKIL